METWYPQAIRKPITTKEYWAPRGATLSAIVDHITDGVDSRDYLQNVNNGSSVHFLVREEGGVGQVYQFMPVEWAAWGNGITSQNNPYMPEWLGSYIAQGGNPNLCTVSIEHERDWPFTTMPSEPMLQATIELHKWLCATFPTIRLDRDHIIGHYQIDHTRRANCPGGAGGLLFPFDDIIAAVKGATPVSGPDTYTDPITGKVIARGFLRYWLTNQRLGRPLSNEESGDNSPWNALPELSGYVCQMFERGALAWRVGQPVVEVRVGALALALSA